jgi:hypothetical protein
MKILPVALLLSLSISLTVFAQQGGQSEHINPLAIQGVADAKSLRDIRREITLRLQQLGADECKVPNPEIALPSVEIAELMKRAGDYRAAQLYECAIKANPDEPVYHYLYAEYLRNFRGAQHPLFPKAEQHYFDALSKLELNPSVGGLIERGLVALYAEDGIPIAHRHPEIPFWFFSTTNIGGQSTSDPDRVDDVRSFTSEALFASSLDKLNRSLTKAEFNRLIRVKEQFETFNRFRFRYKNLPAFDLFYRHREIDDAQITRFDRPNEFNPVKLNEYGVAAEKPIDLAPFFDLFLRGTYKRIVRQGLIEFSPASNEHIDQFEINAVASRSVGPDKVNLEFIYAHQNIKLDNQLARDRTIVGGKFTYQLFRATLQQVYKRRFGTRGIDFFSGVLHDKEAFGKTDVTKNDFFVGASAKGVSRFDFTIQPTVFTSDVGLNRFQKNSQYRTNVTVLYRILDEEQQEGNPAFLHLVFPFRHDVAIEGPKAFENFKAGCGLVAKLFTRGSRRTTVLTSFTYDYQRFPKLGKTLNLFGLNLSLGF